MSDGMTQEENGDMPGDATSDGTESNGGGAPGGNGGMSGKSVTTLIPVSTVVHTTAGTETTFQRLAAGDLLKLLIVTSEDGEGGYCRDMDAVMDMEPAICAATKAESIEKYRRNHNEKYQQILPHGNAVPPCAQRCVADRKAGRISCHFGSFRFRKKVRS